MEDQTDDWSTYLSSAVFAINTSVQKSTKFTPFYLMYGREARFPLEAEKVAETDSLEEAADDICTADTDKYIEEILEKQKSIFTKVDANIKSAQEKQKKQYAERKGITEYGFKIGDKVLRRNMQQKTRKGKKMEDRWLGPYIIVEVTKTSGILKNSSGKILKQRINLSQLKPYHESKDLDPVANKSKENSYTGIAKKFACVCMHMYIHACTPSMHKINFTESDKDLDANGSDRSDLASFGGDVTSSTPQFGSIHSPTPPIHPILDQDTDCSDNQIAGS